MSSNIILFPEDKWQPKFKLPDGFAMRPYQRQWCYESEKAFNEGITRQLNVSSTGCHAIDTEILMFDGSIKKIQDIRIGDQLMGPDSLPRKVLSLCRGSGQMVRVIPTKGESFIVNDDHILSLQKTKRAAHSTDDGRILNISVKDYLKLSKTQKHLYKLYKSSPLTFTPKNLKIDPYLLGLLLGDGHMHKAEITNVDPEIQIYLMNLKTQGISFKFREATKNNRPKLIFEQKKSKNNIIESLEALGLRNTQSGDKFIPMEYKTSTKTDRLQILAGLLDADGHCNGYSFEYLSKSITLAKDVQFIARTLGLLATLNKKILKTGPYKGNVYYRIHISGNCEIIPTKIARKQASPRRQIKNHLRSGFKIESLREDSYFGFTLDKDHLYVMGNFTVTHNTGKGSLPFLVQATLDFPTQLYLTYTTELTDQAIDEAQKFFPGLKVGLEKAEFEADEDCDIVIACVPTLGKKTSLSRLKKFNKRRFDMVYADEAHFSCTPTTLQILRYFDPRLLLGATATIRRSDDIPLSNVYDKVVFAKTLPEFLLEGKVDKKYGPYLCDLAGYRILSETDISNVKSTKEDFNQIELAGVVNNDERTDRIVGGIEKHAKDCKSILIFAVDIDHAKAIAQSFQSRGHSAEWVSGLDKDREGKITAFKNGDLRILCNVRVASFGLNIPRIDCIVLGKPSKSEIYLNQAIGRGTRVFPDKKICKVFDIVDICGQQRPMSIADAFGVRDIDFLGENVIEKIDVLRKAEEIGVEIKEGDTIKEVEKKVDLVSRVLSKSIKVNTKALAIDLFDAVSISEDVKDNSIFPWIKLSETHMAMSMFKEGIAELQQDNLGRWMFKFNGETEYKPSGRGSLYKWADNLLKKKTSQMTWRAKLKSAKYNTQPASDKQLNYLRSRCNMTVFPDKISKQMASTYLDKIILYDTLYKNDHTKM